MNTTYSTFTRSQLSAQAQMTTKKANCWYCCDCLKATIQKICCIVWCPFLTIGIYCDGNVSEAEQCICYLCRKIELSKETQAAQERAAPFQTAQYVQESVQRFLTDPHAEAHFTSEVLGYLTPTVSTPIQLICSPVQTNRAPADQAK